MITTMLCHLVTFRGQYCDRPNGLWTALARDFVNLQNASLLIRKIEYDKVVLFSSNRTSIDALHLDLLFLVFQYPNIQKEAWNNFPPFNIH